MATDTLEIFGTEYTGVTGVKATDSNNQTKTYIRPQGSKSITANGNNIDVAEYATVNVAVPSSSPTIDSLTVTPTTSQQTFNSSSVDGYKPVTVNAMPSGTVTAPSSISGTSATLSTGTNTLTLSKTVSVTPSVATAGYVSSGTAGNSSVSLTASVTTKGAATITPTTTNQTISSGTYLTGAQTISGDANLVAGNIKSGTTIFNVTGSYTGGGGIGTLLKTESIGTVNTSSTTATDLSHNFTVTGVYAYDLLIFESSVDTVVNNRHLGTVRLAYLTASSAVATKDGATLATAVWNAKASNNGTVTTRSNTTARGIYPYSVTMSASDNGTATIVMYRCYNSTQTGTINGSYTTRVYGVKLYDLIGG